MLQVGIHDRTFWRTSHDGAALNVGGLVARCIVTSQARKWGNFFRSHLTSEFHCFRGHIIGHFSFILSPVEREAEQGVTKMVFVDRIQVHVVVLVGKMLA